jgi:hypothetical protein
MTNLLQKHFLCTRKHALLSFGAAIVLFAASMAIPLLFSKFYEENTVSEVTDSILVTALWLITNFYWAGLIVVFVMDIMKRNVGRTASYFAGILVSYIGLAFMMLGYK